MIKYIENKTHHKVPLSNPEEQLDSPIRGQGDKPFIMADRTRTYADKGRNLESPKPISNALSGVQKDNLVLSNRIRRLIPTECERLQGFPDGWTEGISDTQRYKCMGNAVSVPVIEAIGKRLAQGVL